MKIHISKPWLIWLCTHRGIVVDVQVIIKSMIFVLKKVPTRLFYAKFKMIFNIEFYDRYNNGACNNGQSYIKRCASAKRFVIPNLVRIGHSDQKIWGHVYFFRESPQLKINIINNKPYVRQNVFLVKCIIRWFVVFDEILFGALLHSMICIFGEMFHSVKCIRWYVLRWSVFRWFVIDPYIVDLGSVPMDLGPTFCS